MDKTLHDLDQILTAVKTFNGLVKRVIDSLKKRNDRQCTMIRNQREVIRYLKDYIKSEL